MTTNSLLMHRLPYTFMLGLLSNIWDEPGDDYQRKFIKLERKPRNFRLP